MSEAETHDAPTVQPPPMPAKWRIERDKGRLERGKRWRYARKLAGVQQGEAAARLGYTCGVHLSEIEAGKREAPPEKIAAMAQLYGVTLDFIFGLNDEPVADPVAAVQQAVAARISADVQHLTRTLVAETASLVRTYLPSGAMAQRLASLVLEAHDALQRLRERCPAFDREIPASALVSRLHLAASVATEYDKAVRQSREVQVTRDLRMQLRTITTPLTLPVVPEGT